MTDVGRAVVELGGWFGAPGVNVWHFCAPAHGEITAAYANSFLETLYESYSANPADWASGVTITFPAVCPVFEAESGDLLYYAGDDDPQPTVTGSGGEPVARATQALLRLNTSDIRNNRLIRGRVFLGPASGDCLDSTGLIATATRADFENNFAGVVDPLGPRAVVWSRPVAGAGGVVADVNTLQVRDRPGILRGRNE